MKILYSFIFIILSQFMFCQVKTYKFEDIIQYRMKSDFYSDFLNILSTKDNKVNLLITQTPMGNYATIKIGENMYVVYSDENSKNFQIDFEGTKEMLGANFLISDNPNINNLNTKNKNVFQIKKENKEEKVLNNTCEIYSVTEKKNSENIITKICIDPKSSINTVPFFNSNINLKGLIYKIGNVYSLEKIGRIKDIIKNEKNSTIENDFIISFDEKAAIDNYKKQYKEYKKQNKG